MNYLFIINDAPYGNEKSYNALRLATTLQKEQDASVSIFLLGDGVFNAIEGQKTPQGYFNIERMFKAVLTKGADIRLCGSCMDARGLEIERMVNKTKRSTMSELAQLSEAADKILTFG